MGVGQDISRNRGLVLISLKFLKEMLRLPENCEIRDVLRVDRDRLYGTATFIVVSPEFPEIPECSEPPHYDLIYEGNIEIPNRGKFMVK